MSLKFLMGSASDVAPRLLGCILERKVGIQLMRVRIVETEAYDQTDVGSHSYKGQTPRTEVMFGPSGHLYVYFTYGMHYCCNIVVGPAGHGSAVLLRAVEPLAGEKLMAKHRSGRHGIELTNGPAKLCQALSIDRRLNGHALSDSPLKLIIQSPMNTDQIVQTTRIGISRGQDLPWRFYIAGNAYVSRL
ncbi:MAG TPA: DNA-3-methyladenine glycosylase [Candidatus Saccharimonadales bacterium]|nr:DNA-3-methyladenine glycosylase [Candidatus Saccharimonadales bacterium]